MPWVLEPAAALPVPENHGHRVRLMKARYKAIVRYVITVLFLCYCLATILLGAPSQGPAEYLLGPDDQIKVWALGVDEIADKPLRLDPAGDIDLPLIGKVHAGGLTVEQLKATLTQRFSKDLVDPKVSVQIVEFGSQPFGHGRG